MPRPQGQGQSPWPTVHTASHWGGSGAKGTRWGWGAAQLWVLEKDCIARETLSSFPFHFALGHQDACPALGTRPYPLPREVSAFPSQWGRL